jgi:CelD/BcsL family acetyltransferase involved in cellulose biosynthesis
MIDVRVQRSLGPYQDPWDRLVEARTPPPVDQRSWWAETMAGPDSRFVLVVAGDHLIGGLALDITRRWGVTHLRITGDSLFPTEMDLLVDPDHTDVALEHFRRWLRSHDHGVVDLDGLPEQSLLRRALPVDVEEIDRPGSPYIPLRGSFDDYMRRLSRNLRRDLRRVSRRLKEHGVSHRRLAPTEVEFGLATLRRLHSNRFTDDSAFLPYFDRFAQAARHGARRGELAFHVLARDDEVIAIEALAEVDGHLASFQTGMAPRDDRRYRGAGNLLLFHFLEDAWRRGLHEVDLGREPDHFKARLTSHVRPVKRLVGSWGWRSDALQTAVRARARIGHQRRRVTRHLQRAQNAEEAPEHIATGPRERLPSLPAQAERH